MLKLDGMQGNRAAYCNKLHEDEVQAIKLSTMLQKRELVVHLRKVCIPSAKGHLQHA